MKARIIALCMLVTACGQKKDETKPGPVASTSAAVVTSASAAPVASTSAAPAAAGAAGWSGTYTLAAGTISIPSENKDYKGVKQAKDDPSKFMGDGKIELTITGERVAGTLEGAAGPAVIDGSVVEGEIRGMVRRKDPSDDGLTGSLSAKLAGDAAEGKLLLSSQSNAELVREGKVSLKKK
jgi:hypothetical protein